MLNPSLTFRKFCFLHVSFLIFPFIASFYVLFLCQNYFIAETFSISFTHVYSCWCILDSSFEFLERELQDLSHLSFTTYGLSFSSLRSSWFLVGQTTFNWNGKNYRLVSLLGLQWYLLNRGKSASIPAPASGFHWRWRMGVAACYCWRWRSRFSRWSLVTPWGGAMLLPRKHESLTLY